MEDRSAWLHQRAVRNPASLPSRWAHRFAPPPASYDTPAVEAAAGADAARAPAAAAMLLNEDAFDDPFSAGHTDETSQMIAQCGPLQRDDDDDEEEEGDYAYSYSAAPRPTATTGAAGVQATALTGNGEKEKYFSSSSDEDDAKQSDQRQQQQQQQQAPSLVRTNSNGRSRRREEDSESDSASAPRQSPRGQKRARTTLLGQRAADADAESAASSVGSSSPSSSSSSSRGSFSSAAAAAAFAAAMATPAAPAAAAAAANAGSDAESAAHSSRGSKRFAKAHQTNQRRAIVPTLQVQSERPRASESEPPRSEEGASASAAAAPTAAAAAASDPRRKRNSGSSLSSRSSASSASASRASASSGRGRAKPAAGAAAAASAGSPLRWTASQPTARHFPSAAMPVAKSPAPWVEDFLRPTAAYSEQLIDERVAFLCGGRSDSGLGDGGPAGAEDGPSPRFPLPAQLATMGVGVLLRQPGLTVGQAARLAPLIDALVRGRLVPPALLLKFRELLGRAQLRFAPQQQKDISALLSLLDQQREGTLWSTLDKPPAAAAAAAAAASSSALSRSHSTSSHTGVAVVSAPAMLISRSPSSSSSVASAAESRYRQRHAHPPQCSQCGLMMLTPAALAAHMATHKSSSSASSPSIKPRTHWKADDYNEHATSTAAAAAALSRMPALSSSFVAAVSASSSDTLEVKKRHAVPLRSPSAPVASGPSGASRSDAICLDDDDEAPAVTVDSVLKNQRLSLEAAQAFVQASFDADELVHRQKLPLVDPLTLSRIDVPVRSRKCEHVRCMDLATILMQADHAASKQTVLKCPICNGAIAISDLVVDAFLQLRLQEATKLPDASELILHRDGTFEFSSGKKQESGKGGAGGNGGGAAGAAASAGSKPVRTVHTVDLLDTDDEASQPAAAAAASVAVRAPYPPSQLQPRRPQFGAKCPRVGTSDAGAPSDVEEHDEDEEDEDGDDEAQSHVESHCSTPSGRRGDFSAQSSAPSSTVSSPVLRSVMRPALHAPFPSSYPVPRSAWNQPSTLLGQGGPARFASGSMLRPAMPAAAAAASPAAAPAAAPVRGRVVAEIDLTLSSETDESECRSMNARRAVNRGAELETEDDDDDEAAERERFRRTAALAALRQQANSLLMQHHPKEEMNGASAAGAPVPPAAAGAAVPVDSPAGASIDLDAFSPDMDLFSSSLSPDAVTGAGAGAGADAASAAKAAQSVVVPSAPSPLSPPPTVDSDVQALSLYPSVPVHPPSLPPSLALPASLPSQQQQQQQPANAHAVAAAAAPAHSASALAASHSIPPPSTSSTPPAPETHVSMEDV